MFLLFGLGLWLGFGLGLLVCHFAYLIVILIVSTCNKNTIQYCYQKTLLSSTSCI